MNPDEITIGNRYLDARTKDPYVLVYIDANIAIVRDEYNHHVLTRRHIFERDVEIGRYKFAPEVEAFGTTGSMERVLARAEELEAQDGRKAAHIAEGLREAVSILTAQESSEGEEEVPYEKLNHIGAGMARNLRDAGYVTKDDIRNASDSELLAVPLVGRGGVETIRAWVA